MNTTHNTFDFDHPPSDPVAACQQWFEQAKKLPLANPNAMTLSTVGADGHPSSRIVLLRGFDDQGAVFYTNRESRKALALAAHPRAALLFHWDEHPIGRQINIEGAVTHTSDAQSDAYWLTRRRENQISAWASAQSQPIANRAAMQQAQDAIEAKFAGQIVPRPPHWGGYRVALERIELWQGNEFRSHDRVVYTRDGSDWNIQRLCP